MILSDFWNRYHTHIQTICWGTNSVKAPVANVTIIQTITNLMLIEEWYTFIVDVKGAFPKDWRNKKLQFNYHAVVEGQLIWVETDNN